MVGVASLVSCVDEHQIALLTLNSTISIESRQAQGIHRRASLNGGGGVADVDDGDGDCNAGDS